MRQLTSLLASAAIFAAVLLPAQAQAQIKERTLRFAQQNVATSPPGLGMAKFAEIVAAKSGGKLNVRQFPGGQLGGDLPTLSAVQGGTIDITVLNAGLLVGLDKRFAALDLPFMFNSAEEADKIVDGPVGQKLLASLADKGLQGLGYWELGFRNVTNSKLPITKIEDFKGIKLRVLQSPLFIDLFNTLGANTVPLPWPEVYPALEQKVVDGQENPYPTILGAKLNEVQKFVSETRHIYNAQSLLISKKVWDDMSAEEKKIIQDAATEAGTFQRKTSRDAMATALASLKAAGMQHNTLSDAEMARIRKAVEPVVAKFAKDIGEDLVKEMTDALAALRK
ncbi:MAG: TRAP transporter substrate-binding protein [Bosea sp. (in: a-proteobacteria)]